MEQKCMEGTCVSLPRQTAGSDRKTTRAGAAPLWTPFNVTDPKKKVSMLVHSRHRVGLGAKEREI